MPNYIKIEALRMLRNRRYIIFVVGFPVVFYLIFSSIWGDGAGVGGGRPPPSSWSPWARTARSPPP